MAILKGNGLKDKLNVEDTGMYLDEMAGTIPVERHFLLEVSFILPIFMRFFHIVYKKSSAKI